MTEICLACVLTCLEGIKNGKRLHNLNILKEGIAVARMGKKEKRLWVFFLNDKNRIQYNDQCKKCVYECKQSFRCRIVWCGKYHSKRSKGRNLIRLF